MRTAVHDGMDSGLQLAWNATEKRWEKQYAILTMFKLHLIALKLHSSVPLHSTTTVK